MCHRHGDVLMRNDHEARHLGPAIVGKRLDDRREIGSGIGKHVFDPALAEPRDIGFRRHAVVGLDVSHGRIHGLEIGC